MSEPDTASTKPQQSKGEQKENPRYAGLRPWKKGQSGNPKGRAKGSRNKLSETFVSALYEDFQKHGKQSIELARMEDPVAYLRIIASIVPKDFNLNERFEFDFSGVSSEDLAAIDGILAAFEAGRRNEAEESARQPAGVHAPH